MRASFHQVGYLLLLFIGAAVWWPQTAQQGMYNDGIWYAAIARNLSIGTGGWWHPHLSATFGDFVPHPPLVFWLEGGLFTLLGDQWWVERLYSLLVTIATVFAIRWLWRQSVSGTDRRWWWLVVALWSVNEVVYNYYPNNLLDCTMALFALLSVGFLLRPPTLRNTLTAAFFLLAALLAKGPVGLFPLAVPLLRAVCKTKKPLRWKKAALQTLALVGSVLLCLALLWFLLPEFQNFVNAYYDVQIRGGLAGEQVYHARENRLYILGRLTTLLLPLALLTGLAWGLHTRRQPVVPDYRSAGLWVLIGLSASAPLVISPKQTYYYLLAAMPYFYLAAVTLLVPSLRQIRLSQKGLRGTLLALLLLTGVALCFTYDSYRNVRGRHQTVYPELRTLLPQVPVGAVVGSDEFDHTLLGYAARLRRVSIDTSGLLDARYFISRFPASVPPEYEVLPSATQSYRLYRKRD